MARGLKFWIQIEEGLYFPCSENKGADQLRGYREAELRLCFRLCKKPVFSRCGSYALSTSQLPWDLLAKEQYDYMINQHVLNSLFTGLRIYETNKPVPEEQNRCNLVIIPVNHICFVNF